MEDKNTEANEGVGLEINIEPTEKSNEVIYTPQVEEEGKIDELQEDDLDKKNYTKISPTLYVKPVETEEEDEKNEEGEKIEQYKVLNPETGVVETRELTEEEKHEILVLQLKAEQKVFHPIKHPSKTVGTYTEIDVLGRERHVKNKEVQTNLLVNQFDTKYKQKRRRKNSLAKKSRQKNRK